MNIDDKIQLKNKFNELIFQQLIDRRQSIIQEIEALTQKQAELDHEIMCGLLDSGEKQAFGSEGLGVALFSTTRYSFGKMADAYLSDKGILEHFRPEPKITKTKLDELLKEGVIDYNDLAEIDKWKTTEQSPYSLKKVVDKKKAVIA